MDNYRILLYPGVVDRLYTSRYLQTRIRRGNNRSLSFRVSACVSLSVEDGVRRPVVDSDRKIK